MAKKKTKKQTKKQKQKQKTSNVQILHFLGCKTLTLSYHCMKGSENLRTSDKTEGFPGNVGFELFDV